MKRFDEARLDRQLAVASAVRVMLYGTIIAGWALSFVPRLNMTGVPLLLMTVGLVTWIVSSIISARTNREALQAAQALAMGVAPAEADRLIEQANRRFTLQTAIRITLYQQKAMLAQRLDQSVEVARICSALLTHERLRVRPPLRVDLLLMLSEAALKLGDAGSAYRALSEAAGYEQSLLQAAQWSNLRVRYDVMCGHDLEAIENLPAKVHMAELLGSPATADALMLLAEAAGRARRPRTANWLRERARLLGGAKRKDAAVTAPDPTAFDPAAVLDTL